MTASRRATVKRSCCLLAVCIGLLLLPAVGCSGGSGKKSRKAAAGGGAAAAEKLPAIDPDTAIEFDEGRISIASPAGWTRGPRSKDCLVRYKPGPKKTFPAIVVTVSDPPGGVADVTAESQQAFVDAVAASLAETFSKDGKSTLLKKPVAVKLGSHLGAAWTAPGTEKVGSLTETIERACHAVVIGGRMYVVEARGPKGKLDSAGRLAAKAVAGALAVPVPAEPAPPAEPAAGEEAPAATEGEEPPADEKPAEEKPAAEKPADKAA
jgi:hypothetical protein